MTIRVAVLGAGGMGACHAEHIAELPKAELVAVADPDEAVGGALAERLNTSWLPNGLDAITQADAVVIATPDRFHHEYVMAALAAAKPVLCEKPLTVDLGHARSIVDHELATGQRRVVVGFMREYDAAHLQVVSALADLGEVHHLRAIHRNTNDVGRSLHAQLVQSLIHDIHSVRWLTDSEIVRVSCHTVLRSGRIVFVVVHCDLASGAVASIEFNDAAAGYEVGVEIACARGTVTSAEPAQATVRTAGSMAERIDADWFAPFIPAYRTEVITWLDELDDGSAPSGPSAWDGYAAQCVVEAAARSAASGVPEPVELPTADSLYTRRMP